MRRSELDSLYLQKYGKQHCVRACSAEAPDTGGCFTMFQLDIDAAVQGTWKNALESRVHCLSCSSHQ
jgi:hypothetical protein